MMQSLFKLVQQIYQMDNPESLPPSVIYSYDNKTNEPWSLKEYRTPLEYEDPRLQVQKRDWEKQKKGLPDKRYVTKRGYYMDYPLSVAKKVPAPSLHGSNKPWSFEKEEKISKHRTMNPKLIKETYLDKIQIEQRKRKAPGVCSYSLEKSIKEKDAAVELLKKKKHFVGEKKFFYDDTEHISGGVPGAGNYCPHDQIIKIRANKTTYKDWKKKHEVQTTRDRKRQGSLPAPGTYSPMNCTFTTFDTLNSPKKKDSKFEGFGTDARFTYTRAEKKKFKEIRPGPSSYNTIISWKGKGSPKEKNWNEAISKGFQTISIYN